MVKNPPANAGGMASVPRWERSPGVGNATHSSILAWRIPWTEELGGIQFMGLQRVGHNRAHTHAMRKRMHGVQTVDGMAWTVTTKYHTVGGLNQRYLFLIILEAGKPKIKVPADLASGKGSFPDSWMVAF